MYSDVYKRQRLSEPAVIAAMESVRKVRGEIHLMSGFLRFMEGKNGVFYAPFESDNDILELLVPHFTARLKNQPFIIHDTKRHLATLYNQKDCVLVRTDDEVSVELSLIHISWALKNMQLFPVEVNTAPLEMLLRVPGIGNIGAYKIMKARKYNALDFEMLAKMRIVLKRARRCV